MTRKINNSYELGQSNAPTDGGDMLKTRADGTLVWEGVADTTYVPVVYPWGDRGVFGGGRISGTSTNIVDYFTIATPSNATDFGDLTAARWGLAGCSSSTRGVFSGGNTTDYFSDIIDYITISTTSNSTDFGNLTQARFYTGSCSSSSRGLTGGGYKETGGVGDLNIIDYITIATTGNATDFGDLTSARRTVGVSDSTYAIWADNLTIDYVTIATTANAVDFGDLTVSRSNLSGTSDSTRGVFGGGSSDTDTIDYITTATPSNATDFGNLTVAKHSMSACSDGTKGIFAGSNSDSNVIEYITIQTTGNATDFGDLTTGRKNPGALAGD